MGTGLATVSPFLHASPTCISFAVGESDHDDSALSTTDSYAKLSCSTETTNSILAGNPITATATACTTYTGYAGAKIPSPHQLCHRWGNCQYAGRKFSVINVNVILMTSRTDIVLNVILTRTAIRHTITV